MRNLIKALKSINSKQSPLAGLSKPVRARLSLCAGFLIHLILGTFYLWSTLNIYVTSYLVNDGQNYINSQVNAVFPFMMLAINICNPFGVLLAQKIGFRLLAISCSFLLGFSVILSSYVVHIFWLFSTLYGFVFGFASGLLYMLPFHTCYLYYPHRKGFVSGVISGAFGFGATIFLWVVFGMVNPGNQRVESTGYFSKEVSDRLPNTLFTLGWIYLFISLAGSLLLETPNEIELAEIQQQQHHVHLQNHILQTKENNGANLVTIPLLQYDREKDCDDNNSNDDSDTGQPWQVEHCQHRNENINLGNQVQQTQHFECLALGDSLSTSMLYKTIAMAIMFVCFGIMMISNYKPYAQQYGYSDSYLTVIATVGSIVNGLTRLLWGTLNEHLSFRQILLINIGTQILISASMDIAVRSAGLFFIWMICVYLTYGGWFAVLPAVVSKMFGNRVGTSVYGLTFIGFTIAGWTQFFLVRSIQQIIGWDGLFRIFTGIQIIALVAFSRIELHIDWKAFYDK